MIDTPDDGILCYCDKSAVAKCSATNGEYVQSRSRVGSPWCAASASQFQIEFPAAASARAYFLEITQQVSLEPRDFASPASRSQAGRSSLFAFAIPR